MNMRFVLGIRLSRLMPEYAKYLEREYLGNPKCDPYIQCMYRMLLGLPFSQPVIERKLDLNLGDVFVDIDKMISYTE